MFEDKINAIRNILDNFEGKISGRYSLDTAYRFIPFKDVLDILLDNLDLLEDLERNYINKFIWYHINNFQNIGDINILGTLAARIDNLLNIITANLRSMLNNNNMDNGYPQAVSSAVLQLNTLLKDFRFDLDIKRLGVTIDNFYEKVDKLKVEINSLKEDFQRSIGRYEETIKRFEEEKNNTLKNFSDEISKKREEFENFEINAKEELNKLLEDAQKALEWTTASGLNTAFKKRSRWLAIESGFYFILFLISSILTLIVSVSVIFAPEVLFEFIPWIKHPNNVNHIEDKSVLLILTRLGVIGTAVFFSWLMWKNYIKNKLLFEEYKKKEILAQNLMIGANTLIEQFGFSKDEANSEYIRPSIRKILEDSLERIYGLDKKDGFLEGFKSRLKGKVNNATSISFLSKSKDKEEN